MTIDDSVNPGKKLLIVEDEPRISRLYGITFKKYNLILAEDGSRAVEEIARGKFDAIVSDVGLPGKNGWEVYQAAVAKDPSYASKFIFCFSPGIEPVYSEVLKSGVPCVMKASTDMLGTLKKSVENILNGNR